MDYNLNVLMKIYNTGGKKSYLKWLASNLFSFDKIISLKKTFFKLFNLYIFQLLTREEYKIMLNKCLSRYCFLNFQHRIKKFKLYFICFGGFFLCYKLIKFCFVTYFYFMWEVDIRKPKVSDYLIERFR